MVSFMSGKVTNYGHGLTLNCLRILFSHVRVTHALLILFEIKKTVRTPYKTGKEDTKLYSPRGQSGKSKRVDPG
jgi:hypothetical protein